MVDNNQRRDRQGKLPGVSPFAERLTMDNTENIQPPETPPARVETNLRGTLVMIHVGSQDVWLSRDEALAVCDALPSAINHMPVKI